MRDAPIVSFWLLAFVALITFWALEVLACGKDNPPPTPTAVPTPMYPTATPLVKKA